MLYQSSDAEMLFPSRVIPSLSNLRGPEWSELVDLVGSRAESDPDSLAFSLMMIRLDGCMTCHSDSFRAIRGCTLCAQQTVTRFKGADTDLIKQWQAAQADILCWLETGTRPEVG